MTDADGRQVRECLTADPGAVATGSFPRAATSARPIELGTLDPSELIRGR